jgi:tetratricopeptide (TPR) repeat protein
VAGSDAGLDPEVSAVMKQELLAEAKVHYSIPHNAGGPLLSLDLLHDGIARRRRLVHRFPQSPEAHSQLGSFLGMAGKHLGARELVDEGILECKIAAGLLPNWDNPTVECGIMLANIGEYDAALRELELARMALPEATPHLRYVTGYVLTILERHPEALEHLESVIEVRPDFAPVYRYAARCAFELGDKTKGRRYAKAGRQLGDFTEYMAWRDGAYSSR